MPVIEIRTSRLILRPIHNNDAKDLFNYRSDIESNKYQGWIPESIDDVLSFIKNKTASSFNIPNTWFQLAIIESSNDNLIGDLGIHFIDLENRQVEIGCTLSKAHQGKGYAREALKASINYLFHKLDKHRVIASIDPRNTKSVNLVEGLDFRKEAHFKESFFANNKWQDDLIYAILKKEWLANN